jgi:hypothetical protein
MKSSRGDEQMLGLHSSLCKAEMKTNGSWGEFDQ